ncbi:MAG: hypothetical protein IT340_23705 [Chloroflexi bacterium]|nr:hypothetical protein [Chloroflexota bacterium]
MARRQARRQSAPAAGSTRPNRADSGRWRYWLMVAVVVGLALIMVVTSLPLP